VTAEAIFDQALAGVALPPRDGVALDRLADEWAPPAVAPAVRLAVRMAMAGDAESCARALQEAVRLIHYGHQPVPGCMCCGGPGWHGDLCRSCDLQGWALVGCPTCGTFHLQHPSGHVLGGCRWALDQNDDLPSDEGGYTAEDEADMRQQELLDLGGEP
jgi:hypothetical protein